MYQDPLEEQLERTRRLQQNAIDPNSGIDLENLTADQIKIIEAVSKLRADHLQRSAERATPSRDDLAQEMRSRYFSPTKNPLSKIFRKINWELGAGQDTLKRADRVYKENQDNFTRAKDDNDDLIKLLSAIGKRKQDLMKNQQELNKQGITAAQGSVNTALRQRLANIAQQNADTNSGRLAETQRQFDSTLGMTGNPLGQLRRMQNPELNKFNQTELNQDAIRKASLQPTNQMIKMSSTSPIVASGYDSSNNVAKQIVGNQTRTSDRLIKGPSLLQQQLQGGGNGILNLDKLQSLSPTQQGGQPTQVQSPTPLPPQTAPPQGGVSPRKEQPKGIKEILPKATGDKYAAERLQGRRYIVEDAPKPEGMMASDLTTSKTNENRDIRLKVREAAQSLTKLIAENYVKGVTRRAHGPENNTLTIANRLTSMGKSIVGGGQGGFFGMLSGSNNTDVDPSFEWDRYFGDYKNPNDRDVFNYRAAFNQYAKRLGFDETKQATGLAALESERKGLQSMLGSLADKDDVALTTMIMHSIRLNMENVLREKGYKDSQILQFMGRLNSQESRDEKGNPMIEFVNIEGGSGDPLVYKAKQIYEKLTKARAAKENGKQVSSGDLLKDVDLDPEEIFGEMTLGKNMNPDMLPIKVVDIRSGRGNPNMPKDKRLEELEKKYGRKKR